MYLFINVYMYLCIHVYLYICIYVYIYLKTDFHLKGNFSISVNEGAFCELISTEQKQDEARLRL